MRRIGIDVGGTFTDLVMLDGGTGDVRWVKVRSHRGHEEKGFWNALDALQAPLDGGVQIIHGTTIAINTLLERAGARCGLITTHGFRDILELARRDRPHAYGLTGRYVPIVPRQWRVEVTERTDAQGHVLTEVDPEDVRRAVDALLAEGVEAVAIVFLHSWTNPANERHAAKLVRAQWPNGYVNASHEVVPEYREFERTSTTALNAYLRPRMEGYLGQITARLREVKFGSDLMIMQGNGGVAAASTTAEFPVRALLSGPAAGATAAAYVGNQAGFRNLVGFDMGGTSCDVSLIVGGSPRLAPEKLVDFRVPVRAAMVDIHSIGAGGGSIASVTAAGTLQVGPRSAGSAPGPVVYGEGGTEPTVTDANFLLGRLNIDRVPDLRRPAGPDQVAKAMLERVGRPLGLDATGAAAAVIRVVNQQMAGAVRLVSVGAGYDPREFALLAFGGAGPLHASAVARELNFAKVMVPYLPGLTSALGCVLSDLRHDFAHTVNWRSDQTDTDELRGALIEQRRQGLERLRREGVELAAVTTTHAADVQYDGQTHVLTVPLPAAEDATVEGMIDRFRALFQQRFGMVLERAVCRIAALRTAVVGSTGAVDLRVFGQPPEGPARLGTRTVYFPDAGWVRCPAYWRRNLTPGDDVLGPAILEQSDSTVLLEPDDRARVDEFRNLIIEIPTGRNGR